MKNTIPNGLLVLSAICGASLTVSAQAQGNGDPTPDQGVGELVLGAPGVGLTYRLVREMPFAETADLGRYYKFTFTGIEVQADADGVPGSYSYDGYMWDKPKKSNNGHGNNCDGVDSSNPGNSKKGLDSDPTIDDECIHNSDSTSGETTTSNGTNRIPGWWEMWARVNNVQAGSLTFSTEALHKLSNIMRLYLTTPVIFRCKRRSKSGTGVGLKPVRFGLVD